MSALDGLTILRYGHFYDSGGGMEQYLVDLNRTLMARNRLKTIQVQLTSNPQRVGEAEEGRLRRVSLYVEQAAHERAVSGDDDSKGGWAAFKSWIRDRILFLTPVYHLFTGPALSLRRIPRRAGEPAGAGAAVRALHQRHQLDLICLHSAGGADVEEILGVAQAERIPVVYVHHFANERLAAFAMRYQLEPMAGVAGVCGVAVPRYLRGRFTNVSDGIDTEYFQLSAGQAAARDAANPVIFLPSRLTPTKGQADVIRAAGELKRRGLDFRVAFAGRTDAPAFLDELKSLIAQEDVVDRVEFVGQLGASGLRDWYATASVIAFPTRHHEGLPRILLECQAMQVPPVVHDIGGTGEGVLDGETGHVIAVGNFTGLVEKLAALLQDHALRRRMGSAGRRLAEDRFSLAALAARHEQFYLQSLAVAGRRPPPTAA